MTKRELTELRRIANRPGQDKEVKELVDKLALPINAKYLNVKDMYSLEDLMKG